MMSSELEDVFGSMMVGRVSNSYSDNQCKLVRSVRSRLLGGAGLHGHDVRFVRRKMSENEEEVTHWNQVRTNVLATISLLNT